MKKVPLVSCFQCAGINQCYGAKQPDLGRDEARARAAACNLWQKGRTVDIVRVAGREKGMSRKKAQGLVEKGRASWESPDLVRIHD